MRRRVFERSALAVTALTILRRRRRRRSPFRGGEAVAPPSSSHATTLHPKRLPLRWLRSHKPVLAERLRAAAASRAKATAAIPILRIEWNLQRGLTGPAMPTYEAAAVLLWPRVTRCISTCEDAAGVPAGMEGLCAGVTAATTRRRTAGMLAVAAGAALIVSACASTTAARQAQAPLLARAAEHFNQAAADGPSGGVPGSRCWNDACNQRCQARARTRIQRVRA